MRPIIDADIAIALVLARIPCVKPCDLRTIEFKVKDSLCLDIDKDAVGTAVYLHSEIFRWNNFNTCITLTPLGTDLFDDPKYIQQSFGARLTNEELEKINEAIDWICLGI